MKAEVNQNYKVSESTALFVEAIYKAAPKFYDEAHKAYESFYGEEGVDAHFAEFQTAYESLVSVMEKEILNSIAEAQSVYEDKNVL